MARIYKSQHPDYVIPRRSVVSNLFPTESPYDDSLPAFVEAATGLTLSRGDVKDLSFRIASGSGLRITLANSRTRLLNSLTSSKIPERAMCLFILHLGTLFKAFEILNVPANDAQKRVVIMSYGTLPIQGTEKFTQLDSLLRAGKLAAEERFDGELSNETVYLCYSSGTTGLSKGVETTHHNMNTVLTICRPAFPGMIPGKDAMLGILPFYHIYGCVKLVHYPFTVGVPVVISPPFNPDEFCSYIQKYKISGALIVPPVLVVLASHQQSINTTSPRFVSSFQAPRPSEQNSKPADEPHVHAAPITWAEQKVGSAGELLPNLEARLVTEDGTDAKEGEPGEFWLRGPSVMKGYFNNPTATANAITPDGGSKQAILRVPSAPCRSGERPFDPSDIVDVGVIGVHSEEQATELPRAYVVHRAGYNSFKSQAERDAFENKSKHGSRLELPSTSFCAAGSR
ncbi:AMP-binding enzyme C-terminal domain [Rhizoctonia solani]|uniref:AMP-binding enzyme C-terminal domain n=1 Tax=Rhizoctonia solani TaxID=456999 RepID=A0A8H7IBA6_9AGAM|nr:AMP-binding enzyme C-terminal domain [Rhizoctonia solani]